MSKNAELFDAEASLDPISVPAVDLALPLRQAALSQWFTPAWAAEAIVEQALSHLRAGQRVLELTCGDGAFLCALPYSLDVLGVEIDPMQADKARKASGRQVIVGDFLEIPNDQLGKVAAIIGNPPFNAAFIHSMLRKSHELLEDGGQAGFLLRAYLLQASGSVEKLGENFSIRQALVPRNVFPRLSLPLAFVTFTKERERRLFGFMLYREAQEIRAIDKRWKEAVSGARDTRGTWYPVVREIMTALGGTASLEQIYELIQPKRPTGNPHWHAKVRQVVQHPARFRRVGHGRYALA